MILYLVVSALASLLVATTVKSQLPVTMNATESTPFRTSTESVALGAMWRKQINQLYFTETLITSSYSDALGECLKCCANMTVKDKQLDWIKLTNCGSQSFKCLLAFPEIRSRITRDVFWLTSNNDYVLIYMGNSSDVVLNWDYLTGGQKVLEIILLALGGVILVITLVGNILVVVTLFTIHSRGETWWIARITIAVTDLLRGFFVIALAVSNCLCMMTKNLPFSELMNLVENLGFPGSLYEPLFLRRGYSSFCGIVFGVTAVMSMQCHSWLTLERFLICNYPRDKKILTPFHVKIAVFVMWMIALGVSLLFSAEIQYQSFFDPVTKLTFSVSTEKEFCASYLAFWLLSFYFAGLFVFTVVVSLKTMTIFRIRSQEEMAEVVNNTPMFRVKQQEDEDRCIMMTMKLILVLYLVSTVPLVFLLYPKLKTHVPLLYFTCWWSFVLSSSWNWYIYNMRSTFFMNHLIRLLLKCPLLPESLKGRLKNLLPTSLTLDWEPLWVKLDDIMRNNKQHYTVRNEE
ncbi:uncharacterized protein [Cherax quadricarinatus]|uniref:uncharacterized protein n=1 Tax=Cherax quadricarinatus TaxID=27406 RepID=UPI0023780A19|nr:uncharacterized protein LOC128702772 [Cherax quadricarinatus]